MKRIVMLALLSSAALIACDKPSEGDCKKAINNIRVLLGTDKLTEDTGQTAAWVRSCQGSAKKSSVKCAMEASTVEQLERCGILKGVDLEPPASGSGSATK